MFDPIPAGTILYRVTQPELSQWPDEVVSGDGAFYGDGRYNRADQTTVYAATDPIVPPTEAAYYAARDGQTWIGRDPALNVKRLKTPGPVNYKLEKQAWLWAFALTLDPAPHVANLLHPQAQSLFPHPLNLLLNPNHDYNNTWDLADEVRRYRIPAGQNLPYGVLAGILVPSARTPRTRRRQPVQHVLFVKPPFAQPSPQGKPVLPATLLGQWSLRIKFEDFQTPPQPVTLATAAVNWRRPRFWADAVALASGAPVLPFPPQLWNNLSISYP